MCRRVHGHEGSTLNDNLSIMSDDRDENGNASIYCIDVVGGAPQSGGMKCMIQFQKGPLKEAGHNGISDEALIAVVIDRLEGFNSGKYRCRENICAITHLQEALMWLQKRTADRQRRGVEGTHQV